MTTTLSNKQINFLRVLRDTRESSIRNSPRVTRDELLVACKQLNMVAPPNWIVMDHSRRCGRGVYNIQEIVCIDDAPAEENEVAAEYTATASVLAMTNGDRTTIIPDVCKEYVPWGNFEDIKALINTKEFVTIYVTGLSGNGKTTMIEQICAALGRECFRVNIVGTTDEDDLIGGMRLVNGNTVWQDGAVVEAMKRGAVLLLDEIDLATERIMCLQSVLEGKGVYIKKQNEWVTPAKGFCVIATANTKGKGSDDGRFIGTNVLNEAFLDRFDYTFEQEYAPKNVEKKIINKMMKKHGTNDDTFVDNLVTWAEMIRKSFVEGAVDEIISTRRLLNIVKAFSVYGDKHKAVKMALARFDRETNDGFFALFTKIEAPKVEAPATAQATPENPAAPW